MAARVSDLRALIHPSAWKKNSAKFALRDDQVRAVSSTLVRPFGFSS